MIPNGFQTELFCPGDRVREQTRKAFNLPVAAAVIGIVGRFDPQKDHRTFIKAAAQLARRMDGVYFLMCGKGLSPDNQELMVWLREGCAADQFLLLGERNDLNHIYCAMDVFVSSSAYGEGFPNVIGEAMACCVPCVVTDVGDSAIVVGNTGRVVPPRDPKALANGIYELLTLSEEEKRELGEAARRRIEENFSLSTIAVRYADLYEEVLAQCAE